MFTILSLSYDERELQPKSVEPGCSLGWAKIAMNEADSQLRIVRVIPDCVLSRNIFGISHIDLNKIFNTMKKDVPNG